MKKNSNPWWLQKEAPMSRGDENDTPVKKLIDLQNFVWVPQIWGT